MKRRKAATYVCLGAGCVNQVRMRVPARRGPKPKPPTWRLMWARAQDADGGVLREAALLFCSRACIEAPAESGAVVAAVHAYLGAPAPPPDVVTYHCVACAATADLTAPRHENNNPQLPPDWLQIPLIAVDYDTGIERCTTLAACSEACLNTLDEDAPAEKQPAVVQRELERVLAGVSASAEDAVFA